MKKTLCSGKEKWKVKFKDERVVMWDMTDIQAYGLSDTDILPRHLNTTSILSDLSLPQRNSC
jgi:hypothetical protein